MHFTNILFIHAFEFKTQSMFPLLVLVNGYIQKKKTQMLILVGLIFV